MSDEPRTWIVEPRDPLIVRDGRPFGPFPGARAESLPFPFPSTIAGAARTLAGLDKSGCFDTSLIEEVKRISIRGPLLVELNENGGIDHWLCPAPADALLFENSDGSDPGKRQENAAGATLRRLVPLQLPEGAETDLNDGSDHAEPLAPVGLPEPDRRKPHSHPPRFWYWEKLREWLEHPEDGPGQSVEIDGLGHGGPVPERRTHISISGETGASVEGALFQTSGLEFMRRSPDKDPLSKTRRLALAVYVESAGPYFPRPGLAPLGGERRLVEWRAESDAPTPLLAGLECPESLREAIVRTGTCRMMLLTPAHFRQGSLPAWAGMAARSGVVPHLVAMAVGRPQVISGWDYETGKPKPTRRLAPAGTILYLRLEGDASAITEWVNSVWLRNVSDGPQDCRDGFGLAVLGVWDGEFREMK